MTAVAVLVSSGTKNTDGSDITLQSFLGREPMRVIPPRELTEAEQEQQAWDAAQAQAKHDRAVMEIYRINALRAQREGAPGPEVLG